LTAANMIFTMTISKSRASKRDSEAARLALEELRAMIPTFLLGDGLILIISGICGLAGMNADWRVISGLLAGNAVTALNFYLIGVTAGYVIRRRNPEKAKRFSGFSYGARYIGMFLIFGALIYFNLINPVTALAPLFYPKLHYTASAMISLKSSPDS